MFTFPFFIDTFGEYVDAIATSIKRVDFF